MRGKTLKEHIHEKMGQPEFKRAWEELDSDSVAYVRGLRAREGKRLWNGSHQEIKLTPGYELN